MTIRQRLFPCESAFLGTIHKGELYGEFDGFITSFSKSPVICLLISCLCAGGNLYCFVFTGDGSVVVILCSILFVHVNVSPGR